MADFISFMVLVHKREQGLGTQQFRVSPRVGDYISLDDENKKGQIYEVLKVIHVTVLVRREMECGRSPLTSITGAWTGGVARPNATATGTRRHTAKTATGFKNEISRLGHEVDRTPISLRSLKPVSVVVAVDVARRLLSGGARWTRLRHGRKPNWLGKKESLNPRYVPYLNGRLGSVQMLSTKRARTRTR
jgi:hypothetical protein